MKSTISPATLLAAVAGAMLITSVTGCDKHASPSASVSATTAPVASAPVAPAPSMPQADGNPKLQPPQPRAGGGPVLSAPDLTAPGAVARGTVEPQRIDTRTFPRQIQSQPFRGQTPSRRVREMVPDHSKPGPTPEGEPNNLVAGLTLPFGRTNSSAVFPTLNATIWTPPDPSLAVGPNHVVVTVNTSIAWYTRSGTPQFESDLGSAGNPGFFEPIGSGNFCFDPKCFYDHYAQRFVVLALETYNNNESWITIAVSDDSDPNGTWNKYRTQAVLNVNGNNCWWDFPGLGYDQNAYYITGNLFGFNGGLFGVGVRVFDKTPLLSGSAATYSTLRIDGAFTVMPALHFGSNQAAYLVNPAATTNMRVYAITNPTSNPAITFTNVAVPTQPDAISAPTQNGAGVSTGGVFTMPYWRNGRLVSVVNSSTNGRNVARFHEFDTGTWPASGSVTRTQSGSIDAGSNLHTIFPAIAINGNNDIGVSVGVTGQNSRIGAATTGRFSTDPLGTIGTPTVVRPGQADGGGRWGDYYAICIDPNDDLGFWAIGEYLTTNGTWNNWVSNFYLSTQTFCVATPDNGGITQGAPVTVDVLANDSQVNGLPITIQRFDARSTLGGTVTRSVGTGPSGRDQLTYAPPTGVSGTDTFNYTITDGTGTATTAVTVRTFDPALYIQPDQPAVTRSGAEVGYYNVSPALTNLPDFTALTPFAFDLVPNIDFAPTSGPFATSGISSNVGAVFNGYVEVSAADLYTFSLNSTDGSRMYLGEGAGILIVDNNGVHPQQERSSDVIGLRPGRHKVRIEYFSVSGTTSLTASIQGTTSPKAPIAASAWSNTPPCPANFTARPIPAARTVALAWSAPAGVNPPTVSLYRDGAILATGLLPSVSSFIDSPPLPAQGRHVSFTYTLVADGGSACVLAPQSVIMSSGDVRFFDSFDTYSDTAALVAAGWTIQDTPTAIETATWSLRTSSYRSNPPAFDGTPTIGKYLISDSDRATGINPVGSLASHDVITPPINGVGLTNAFLHFDAVAQLKKDGTAVFDIDVRSDQDQVWRTIARRVAPSRRAPAPAVSTFNADGQFGRSSVNVGSFLQGRTNVRFRFRHFEPSDDLYIAIDNVLVDDVDPRNGGADTLLANQTFGAGIPANWTLRGLQTGNNTWTTADPCARGVPANGGIFPRNGGQAVGRLGTAFAILDSSCGSPLPHDDYLITPAINCAQSARVYLVFKSETVTSATALQEVLLSLDGGATFQTTPVFSYNAGALREPNQDPVFDAKSIHVPAAAGQNNVAFAFHFADNTAGRGPGIWWAIDDVKITSDAAPAPTCPADFNGDLVLNADDLGDFITGYFNAPPDPRCDFNADGTVNADDLGDFITAYFNGCP